MGDPETTHIEIVEEVCTVAEHERLTAALEESERRVEELEGLGLVMVREFRDYGWTRRGGGAVKAECGRCHRWITLRRNGELRLHGERRVAGISEGFCDGLPINTTPDAALSEEDAE
jgi:hypothetical protein